jgi:hypothetical protein
LEKYFTLPIIDVIFLLYLVAYKVNGLCGLCVQSIAKYSLGRFADDPMWNSFLQHHIYLSVDASHIRVEEISDVHKIMQSTVKRILAIGRGANTGRFRETDSPQREHRLGRGVLLINP